MKYIATTLQLFLLLLVVLLAACEDNRSNDLFDDKVYLLTPDLNKIDIFNWGSYDYELIACKGGVGQQEATLQIALNESLLMAYNTKNRTNYKLLPKELYQLKNNQCELSISDTRGSFYIVFNTAGIKGLQEQDNSQYALPVQITTTNSIETDTAKMTSIIVPKVYEPYIQFEEPGFALTPNVIDVLAEDEIPFLTKVMTNYNNKEALSFTIETDKQALDEYNKVHGTSYLLFPEKAYSFTKEDWNLMPKTNIKSCSFKVLKKNLIKEDGGYLFGDYVLPLRITQVSKHKIDPEKSIQLIRISFQPAAIDRTEWEVIDCSSERVDDGGGKNTVIDGKLDTYWHSLWEPDAPLPHYLVIDMMKEYNVLAIELIRRKDNTNTKLLTFELSVDGKTFTEVGKMDFGDVTHKEAGKEIFVKAQKARYLKCYVRESNDPPYASIAEIYVKGTK